MNRKQKGYIAMKLFLLVLATCVTVAFGVEPLEIGDPTSSGYNPEPSDGAVYTQTYVNDEYRHGWAWGQECDDFELTADAGIVEVIIWIASIDHDLNPILPTDYCDIAFIADIGDDDPNTATPVWSGTATCTYAWTGDGFGGGAIPIYALYCILPSTANLTAGQRYWLVVTQFYEDNYRFYSVVTEATPIIFTQSWLNDGAEDPVWETGYDTFGYEADMFFELWDTIGALDNSTWGNIKSIF